MSQALIALAEAWAAAAADEPLAYYNGGTQDREDTAQVRVAAEAAFRAAAQQNETDINEMRAQIIASENEIVQLRTAEVQLRSELDVLRKLRAAMARLSGGNGGTVVGRWTSP